MMICLDPYSILEEERDRLRAELAASDQNLKTMLQAAGEEAERQLAAAREEIAKLRHALIRLSCHPCRFFGSKPGWTRCKGNDPDKMCDMCCAKAILARAKEGEKR